jgi:hypothetical protein
LEIKNHHKSSQIIKNLRTIIRAKRSKQVKHNDFEEARRRYRTWSAAQLALPLFYRDWWLDAACGTEGWSAALAGQGDTVAGALPFHYRRRFGVSWILPPLLTPFLGPWLVYPGGLKRPNRYSFEKRILTELIDLLPSFTFYVQKWHYRADNWLPFYWRGFQQQTQYSYVIEPLDSPGEVWAGFRGSVRTDIRKAEARCRVAESEDISPLYALTKQVFERQGRAAPFSLPWLSHLYRVVRDHGSGRLYYARDEDRGMIIAGILVVWDHDAAYLLLTGRDDAAAGGAVSLLIWQALRELPATVQRFDFEGSMMPGVERYFRSFGGERRPYFLVTNRWYQLWTLLRR